MKISIVSPVYKAADILPLLVERIQHSMQEVTTDYEVILVNDGSPDNAWQVIKDIASEHTNITGVNLTRNFGQHYAITAGLAHSFGDWVVVMDCDLQDNPQEIGKLLKKTDEGFDVVLGRRIKRKDPFIKGLFSKWFYKLFDRLTDNNSDNKAANFGIYSRQSIDYYLLLSEKIRLFPLMIKWLGFKIGYVDIEHSMRISGTSSYNYLKLISLAFDTIISQTNKPLRMSIKFGFSIAIASLMYLLYLIFQKLWFNVSLGWTSIMVSIFFIGGLLFANLGLIGIYIGKIYDEVKNRPIYIVREVVGNWKGNIRE